MQEFNLTVVMPFGDYQIGDVISDQEIVKKLTEGGRNPSVIRSAPIPQDEKTDDKPETPENKPVDNSAELIVDKTVNKIADKLAK